MAPDYPHQTGQGSNAMIRQMKLIGFLQAQNCSNYPASWRHPTSKPNWFAREYYEDIGRTLEQGKFHLAFFDDRLAIPDRYGDDFRETIRHGIRAAKLDPIAVALTMGLVTKRLGIGVTYSTPTMSRSTSRACSQRLIFSLEAAPPGTS
jgi:hypothetical protein